MDSDKALQVGKIVAKIIVKKGVKDLIQYGLPVLATVMPMIPVIGDIADIAEGVQEIVGVLADHSGDDYLA